MKSESKKIKNICRGLREKLGQAVRDLSYDGTTLSGGLDTSIINYIASKQENEVECISVGFEESTMEDMEYARIVADELNLKQHAYIFDFSEVRNAAKEVIQIMGSFDPMEVRNSVSIYIAMKEAKELGMDRILTGDGSDELFAGYSFLYNLPTQRLEAELKKVWKIMRFSSQPIAKSLGMGAKLPYLQEEFKRFAMNIKPELKVGVRDGKKMGKWILRKAYEDRLPDNIIWRRKTPIEMGTGTTTLPEKLESLIDEEYFESKKAEVKNEEDVIIQSKEQLFYYEIYKSLFGTPKPEDPEKRTCPYCKTNIPEGASFCRTCGSGLENRKDSSN
ncbi:hypothetical protein AKJ43_00335 [candidate division MSBL1 archaeon SCGC-AAA261D19]|uniref:Asparagine synthetase domain-containing protein n=1 Tax=candidate division MSBL1 archaeon SCGC-AAA261D19 TaxID=1698273 RepID=A0A133V8U7_9EURY|nr:hypothetical protein AKJ43_00335 [candidate division MSBL1 archaeon SCGC-AAA261D19]